MLFRKPQAKLTRRIRSVSLAEEYWKRFRIRLKSDEEVEGIARAGELVVRTLDMVAAHIRPGMTGESLN